jgi:hypothetical protein
MIEIVFHKTNTPPVKTMAMFLGSELNVDTVKSAISALWLDNYHREGMLGLLDCTDWLTKNGMSEQGPKVTTSIHAITKIEAAEHSKDTSVATQAYQWLNKAHSSLSKWLESNNPLPKEQINTLFWSDDLFDYDVFTPTRNTLLSPPAQIVENKKFTNIALPMRMTLTLHPQSGAQAFSELFDSPRTAMSVIFNHEYMHAYQKYRCREDTERQGTYAQSAWSFSTNKAMLDTNPQAQVWGSLITHRGTTENKLSAGSLEILTIFQSTISS